MSPRRPDMPELRRANLAADPIVQFGAWFEEASESAPLPEAITLATVDDRGAPDARMVLLKGVGPDGFRFFTNYESAKAGQLDGSRAAAIVAYWRELDRSVRARGSIERLGPADSDAYFATRPRGSQLGAWASPQSHPVGGREELDRLLAAAEERFEGGDVPRPGHWGGYLLRPVTIEFWQGRVGRLHDRFLYTREGDGWRIDRLGP
jgi:pyridoxamine 5'-phosphate oxidase